MLAINNGNLFLSQYLQAILFSMVFMSIPANSTVIKTGDLPIHLVKGHISTTIDGKLSPEQNEHWYQFSATSGQYTLINIAPRADTPEMANVGILHMPNGQQDGSKGGIIYQGCLPVSGQYRLRIARNLMAAQGGSAGYTAEIVILPRYASQALCQ